MSKWMYYCELGLAQDTCKAYRPDPRSRGYGRYGGCPSCVHRLPANAETAEADAAWKREQQKGR